MSKRIDPDRLSRRERQVVEILYRRGEATVAEITDDLIDPPTPDAVRSVLRILLAKGVIRYREDGPRYVYFPAGSSETVRNNALRHLIETYFANSAEAAMTALLRLSDKSLSSKDVARLRALARDSRREEDGL